MKSLGNELVDTQLYSGALLACRGVVNKPLGRVHMLLTPDLKRRDPAL